MSLLWKSLQAHAQNTPSKIALSSGELTYSYARLAKELVIRQSILAGRRIKVLGLQLSNGLDWILWDIAAAQNGIVCVPLPLFFTPEQIAHVIEAAGIEECITETGFMKTQAWPSFNIPVGTAKITFTSGTTGTPKGVCLPADGLEQVAQSLVDVIGANYAGRHLSVMPLSILLENIAGVYASLVAGGTVFIPAPDVIGMTNPFQPDFTKLLRFIDAEKITSLILVPELLRGLIKAAHENAGLTSSLQFVAVGGSKVSPPLLTAARKIGLPVYEGYGLSECGSVVALNTPSSDHPGTVGRLLPHINAHIEDGEIMIGNPLFLGYLGDIAEAPEVFPTGDVGSFDDKNALQITGRRKNIIITSQGRNISPEWLESVFLTQPEIAQIVVYGDALPYPEALIVPVAAGVDIAALIERINPSLPPYAQISKFHLVPPFTPQNGLLTGTGRPRREKILFHYQTIITQEENHDVLRQAG